ncbi:MAG: protein kinase [Myxococcaceae bacterium]|nr:protein kinase [Myxococcaceae bacterium]
MAELYLAKDVEAKRLVVIKRILPYLAQQAEFVQMFLDEARIAAQLHHPNIIQVYELGSLEGSIFLAMEFVEGVDLRKILQAELARRRLVPPKIAASLTATLCSGLDYAHKRKGGDGRPLGIIHRDVSPQNLMVGFKGEVKLVDFGIAKATAFMERSQPGIIKGKFLYLSPEQLAQERVDHRADIFAVGTMLYEVTTGRSPFFKPTTEGVIYAIRAEDPQAPHLVSRDVPVEISRVVMRCLVKDRDKRYQHAGEIQADLEDYLQRIRFGADEVRNYVSKLFGADEERTQLFTGNDLPPTGEMPPVTDAAPAGDEAAQEVKTNPVRTSPHAVVMRTVPTARAIGAMDALPTTDQVLLNEMGLEPTHMATDLPAEFRASSGPPVLTSNAPTPSFAEAARAQGAPRPSPGIVPRPTPPPREGKAVFEVPSVYAKDELPGVSFPSLPREPRTTPQRPSALKSRTSASIEKPLPVVSEPAPSTAPGVTTDPNRKTSDRSDAYMALGTADITGQTRWVRLTSKARAFFAQVSEKPWLVAVLACVVVLLVALVAAGIMRSLNPDPVASHKSTERSAPPRAKLRPQVALPVTPALTPVPVAPVVDAGIGEVAPAAEALPAPEVDNKVQVNFTAPKDTAIQDGEGRPISPNGAGYFVPGKHKVTFRCVGRQSMFTEFEVKATGEVQTVTLRCPKK